jgi:carboxylate-amine ligase
MALHLFQAFGVELEYMIVDRETLDVRPVADRLLQLASKLPDAASTDDGDPEFPGSVELGPITWSNELCLHVVEFKTTDPAPELTGLDSAFATSVRTANRLAAELGCMLMPTAMHPWMNPDLEMRLWPHDYSPVYRKFHEIFDCRGHGWANLQSVHLNLPFCGDDTPDSEFGRLHAAVRALLPVLPAIAASSPIMDGRPTGLMDSRMEVYRTNSSRIPAATGRVIPEQVFTRADYEREILGAIYKAYEPFDPDGMMRDEWANSRGAIARFGRGSIEIRVLDVQECPGADIAICAVISSVLRAMVERRLGDLDRARSLAVEPMYRVLMDVIRSGGEAVVSDPDLLGSLGLPGVACRASELWTSLIERTIAREPAWMAHKRFIDPILLEGCLARRMLDALAGQDSRDAMRRLYLSLARGLDSNTPLLLGEWV